MGNELKVPHTLQEAIIFYADPKVCHDTMVQVRWPNGVRCPHCQSEQVTLLATRAVFKCKNKLCRKQFTVKVGTIFEDSPLPLSKWLPALWLLANCKNGISSYEVARGLGVQQRTAWFMLHRIRHAMSMGGVEKLSGTVEADETYMGGKVKNMHASRRPKNVKGMVGKVAVMGLLERGGTAKAKVIKGTSHKTLHPEVRSNVEIGSLLITDAHGGYKGLETEYIHAVIDHAVAYVRDHVVHTNGLENFWSLLKRTVRGTYVAVEADHLDAYLAESTFRFNERDLNDAGRFLTVAKEVAGKRLTYRQLTGRNS